MKYKVYQISLLLLIVGVGIAYYLLLHDEDVSMDSSQKTPIEFAKTEIDLGILKQGKPETVTFTFKNTGNHPSVIYNVDTSCGCTEANWPKKPIKPSKEGTVSVTYDAKTPGKFIKTITLYGNFASGSKQLQIKGEVNIN